MTEALDHRFWEIFRQGWAFREHGGRKSSETLLDRGASHTDLPTIGHTLSRLFTKINLSYFHQNHSGSIKNLIINSSAQLGWNTIRFLIQKLLTYVSDFPLNGPFWQIETFSKYPAIIRIENYLLKIHYLFFFNLKYAYFSWGYTNFLNVITVHFYQIKSW